MLPQLQNLYGVYKSLFAARQKRGAIDFDTTETYIVCNAQGKIEQIIPRTRNDAHKLIEECMLAANVCAADFLKRNKHPGLFRVHAGPTAEKLENLRTFLRGMGLTLGGGDKPHASDYAALMAQIRDRPDAQMLQTMLLRSMQQAVYSPDNIGHFGLAYEAYAHFTSPIRRYPDLLTHRAIYAILQGRKYQPEAPHGVELNTALSPRARAMQQSDEEKRGRTRANNVAIWEELGLHCSANERRADEASRDVEAWLKCYFMRDKLGEEYGGMVSGVTSFGIFVQLDSLFIEGLVHVTELGSDYFQYDEIKNELRGERTGIRYRLSDRVRVQVSRVDLDARKIDFRLVRDTPIKSPGSRAALADKASGRKRRRARALVAAGGRRCRRRGWRGCAPQEGGAGANRGRQGSTRGTRRGEEARRLGQDSRRNRRPARSAEAASSLNRAHRVRSRRTGCARSSLHRAHRRATGTWHVPVARGLHSARIHHSSARRRRAQSKVVSVMSRLKVLYGFHAVTARMRHDASTVEEVYYDATRKDRRMTEFLHAAKEAGVRLIAADETRLWGLAHTERHQGVVARAGDMPLAQNLAELLDGINGSPLILVLDGVTDPHNLGACLRVADAAGAHAVIAPRDRAVGLNATAAKVASGAADTVPYITVTNLARALRELKDAGVWVVGTAGEATKSLYDTELDGPVALVMGAEGEGMRRLTRDTCDVVMQIPMAGTVESLNVSVASGVCLFEAVRQRAVKK